MFTIFNLMIFNPTPTGFKTYKNLILKNQELKHTKSILENKILNFIYFVPKNILTVLVNVSGRF